MTFRDQLLENPSLKYENNIFYQKDFHLNNSFEEAYLKLRKKKIEFILTIVVKELPEMSSTSLL